jgi:hypothetical protein
MESIGGGRATSLASRPQVLGDCRQRELEPPTPRASQTQSAMWRTKCEASHQEMARLIISSWPMSQEENQVRKIQFAALI